ncbi:LacI family DNA-binding transcriptional regulator [Lentibacillus salinarum]|uniref:LacI family DNA-binding transcriptional regulator n=1 Tax=Lentibacillus salinarum TaxID=446820 RepID=A0ABW3ZX57_9BACI
MKPTIYDVAKEANVSIATVSKVLNNTGRIGEHTKKRVISTMKDLNYAPSSVASALTKKQTDSLGLIIPDISNPFYSEVSRVIEDAAFEKGLTLFICSTDYNIEKERKYIELLHRKQVDGYIIASGFKSMDLMKGLIDDTFPIALFAQDSPTNNFNVISVDDYKGGYLAINHLLSLGHRNIGVIAEYVNSSKIRLHAYRDLCDMYGLPVQEKNIKKTIANITNGEKMMKELLQQENPPTAVFACNDALAIGAMKAAREFKLNIPKDVSIIGFDNTILSSTGVPELTTIQQPINEMGKEIVDAVIHEMRTPESVKQRKLFTPALIERESTGEV